jgi:hypothetical protein
MWDFSDIFRTPSGPHDAEQSECRTGLGRDGIARHGDLDFGLRAKPALRLAVALSFRRRRK